MDGHGEIPFGALIPTREAAVRGAPAASLVEFARVAEAEGFDSVWAGDSLVARPRLEPLTLLAGVATACPTVTLGTAALTGALRHPLLAAHAIATLDQLAEGRLILGLGAGFPYPETQAEFDVVGVDFATRVGRLTETVALWRRLWDPTRDPSEPVHFEGKHFTFDGIEGLPLPHRPGGPPLWLAGGGERALRRAGRLFDGWLPYPPKPDDYARALALATEAAAQAGRNVDGFVPALYVTVNLQRDKSNARAELERYVLDYYGLPLELMEQLQGFYAGNAEGCAQWLRGFIDAGARHVVIRFGSFDGLTHLRRGAAELLPLLRPK